jgi:thiosulfate/3-mercaptopyruvate sulfurtransferase
MTAETSRFVVSAAWVEKNLGAPNFRIVDASFYLPAQKRNAAEEYAEAHIPGAVLFDHDLIADHSSDLPHMVPAPDVFAEAVGRMGISETDTVVVYDGIGVFASPRAWWLFRTMGAENVFVLDGGMDGWKREGRPVTSDLSEPAPATFRTRFDPSRVTALDQMKAIVAEGRIQIADARSAGRFAGTDPEPREGLRSGHMPGAKSMPVTQLSAGGYLKSLPELKAAIEGAGIDLSRPVVTSCGSGITAAIITLSLASLGHGDNSLYDGSWTEWGGRTDTPVVTGKD